MRWLPALLTLAVAACTADDSVTTVEQGAGAVTNTTNRWFAEDNRVTVFTPVDPVTGTHISQDHWTQVLAAMRLYNRFTPIHMVAGCSDASDTHPPTCGAWANNDRAHLLIVDAGDNVGRTYSRSALSTALNTDPPDPKAAPFSQYLPMLHGAVTGGHHEDYIIGFHPGGAVIPTTAAHEMGHALGLIHEQQRTDAPRSLDIYDCCHVAGFDQPFNEVGASVNYAPYDLRSMMQYDSTGFMADKATGCYTLTSTEYVSGVADTAPEAWRTVTCLPRDASGAPSVDIPTAEPQAGWLIDQPVEMSAEDRNELYQMYPPALGHSDADDDYGRALVAADFDGDHYTDLAVGAPGDAGTGTVYIYKGTFTGLMPWRQLVPNDGVAGARFGAEVAAGDFDGDGLADLVVGEPHAPVSGHPAAGKLWIYHGDTRGPRDVAVFGLGQLGLAATPVDQDHLGRVLATGDFNADGRDELVLGLPARHLVYVVKPISGWPSPAFSHYAGFGAAQSADFGAALATGRIDGDLKDDLVIGGPSIGGTGRVFVTHGTALGFGAIAPVANPSPTADRFGAALAVFASGAGRRIAVGAPAWSGDAGRVVVLGPDLAVRQLLTEEDIFGLSGPGQFGTSLAAGNTDGGTGDHLLVGAPFVNSGAGAVITFFANTDGVYQLGDFFGRWSGDAASGHYGATLAIGNFDGIDRLPADVAVGEPGMFFNSGELWIIHGRLHAPLDYCPDSPNVEAIDNYATENTTLLVPAITPRRGTPAATLPENDLCTE